MSGCDREKDKKMGRETERERERERKTERQRERERKTERQREREGGRISSGSFTMSVFFMTFICRSDVRKCLTLMHYSFFFSFHSLCR